MLALLLATAVGCAVSFSIRTSSLSIVLPTRGVPLGRHNAVRIQRPTSAIPIPRRSWVVQQQQPRSPQHPQTRNNSNKNAATVLFARSSSSNSQSADEPPILQQQLHRLNNRYEHMASDNDLTVEEEEEPMDNSQQPSGQDTLEQRPKTQQQRPKILEEDEEDEAYAEEDVEAQNSEEIVWLDGTSSNAATSTAPSVEATPATAQPLESPQPSPTSDQQQPPLDEMHLELQWCNSDVCKETIRERVVRSPQSRNSIVLTGPATGQVAYSWVRRQQQPPSLTGSRSSMTTATTSFSQQPQATATQSVLLLIRPGDEDLLEVAAKAVQEWISPSLKHNDDKNGNNDNVSDIAIEVWLDPSVAARLEHHYGVRPEGRIQLFEGEIKSPQKSQSQLQTPQPLPDLICTLGGDGLLMHAGLLFQGPVPPILCVAGGSLGFLTPFHTEEMVEAVRVALGLVSNNHNGGQNNQSSNSNNLNVYPPNMPSYPYEPLQPSSAFGLADRLCLSIRMRLCCRILNLQGVCRAEFNVLNEVVIDRGSSPYLAALECFCDDSHLTTVQADGIIFATPTGSTAYSMAAGGSVVHPAVPSILVTPICPHVLSFRSMIFPDHVVLQCVVPDDARSEASVAFDGKHRQPLHRGDCLEVSMSNYPVPTLNRLDHSSDWLSSLKRTFGFNARPRQRPLSPDNS